MKKVLNSLTTKLIVSFVVLIALIVGLMFFYIFGSTKDALKESSRSEIKNEAAIMASQINGDEVLALKAGDESTFQFTTLRDKILNMRQQNPEIAFSYIMTKTGDEVKFIVDDTNGIEEDAAAIEEVYPDADVEAITGALTEATASKDFYTDEWGTFMSGYAPIKDSSGKVVAVLGADLDSTKVIEKQNFIGSLIYYIMAIAFVFAGVLIGLFAMTIIRDINKLNVTAGKISMGDTNVSVDVKRSDEIGVLAESFSRMVASLKIMMPPTNVKPTEGGEGKK